jgi:hypothetical protein|tara:strand:- start:1846 stop:2061 length:216 start_codon:yes stop_codon:yes gene_type:complete
MFISSSAKAFTTHIPWALKHQPLIDAEAMDDMTMAALSYIEDIYQQSWERKDALDQAHAAEDREAIEAISW